MMRAPAVSRPCILTQLHRLARARAWSMVRPQSIIVDRYQAVTVHYSKGGY